MREAHIIEREHHDSTVEPRRRVPRAVAALVVAVLVTAAIVLLDLGDRDGDTSNPCPTVDPPSAQATPGSIPGSPTTPTSAVPPADIDYLDGKSYLRGVNVFDLQSRVSLGVDCTALNPASSYEFLAERGVQLVRLAVPWSFLQPKAPGESTDDALSRGLDPTAVGVLRSEIASIGAAGMRVVLDLHNNGTYPASQGEFPPGTVWFGAGISIEQAQRVWRLLSDEFKTDEDIAAYDLFNEVRLSMVSAPTYKTYIRAVVRAIRENGDMHTLWVEGMKEAATGGLPQIAPDGPWINDPLDRIVYSQHFYPGGTGTALRGADDAGPTSGSAFLAALRGFGDWCTTFGVRCSVGEVGWPSDESLDVAPGDPQSWNAVGARFYTLADSYGMDVTYFGSTRKASCGWLMAYCGDGEEIDDARSQSTVIEQHLSR